MNMKIIAYVANVLLTFTSLSLFSSPSYADPADVLDASQHPVSPKYETVFSANMIPLDASLSWTKRFNGDESFNAEQVLAQATTETDGSTSGDSMPSTMDAMGVVKSVRLSQGKIKIEHGPIDKYGMPGMTMVFKVADPAQLQGLEEGEPIGFDIDNSSGGFVITDIEKISE